MTTETAWFICALAVAWPQGPVVAVEGRVDGHLTFPPRGDFGFGYDPILHPPRQQSDFRGNRTGGQGGDEPPGSGVRGPQNGAVLKFCTPALGLYVHWPYCARICPYCDFNVVRGRGRGRAREAADLISAMVADLESYATLAPRRRLVSIFFGGGTPSLMAPEDVGRVIATARGLWPNANDVEVTLEANPSDAEAERFSSAGGGGINRLSLGVQSLDDRALHFLGGAHDSASARQAAERARDAFPRLSIDL